MYKIKLKQVDEVNMMFETIKTILITGLSSAQIKKLLKTYTHYEIRCGYYERGKFIVKNIIVHDKECRKHTLTYKQYMG